MRRIKRRNCNYAYVEIMACPKGECFGLVEVSTTLHSTLATTCPCVGCTNGAGQLRDESVAVAGLRGADSLWLATDSAYRQVP